MMKMTGLVRTYSESNTQECEELTSRNPLMYILLKSNYALVQSLSVLHIIEARFYSPATNYLKLDEEEFI